MRIHKPPIPVSRVVKLGVLLVCLLVCLLGNEAASPEPGTGSGQTLTPTAIAELNPTSAATAGLTPTPAAITGPTPTPTATAGPTPTPAVIVEETPPPTSTSVHWPAFRDPIYGYRLAYPSSWQHFTERNGSSLTLYNPLTRTTINPIITTQNGSPADLLQQALSVAHTTRISLAGQSAAATATPYLREPPGSNTIDLPADGGPQRVELVTLPVANLAGTTNLYRFRLTQPTDLQGQISFAEENDLQDFIIILNSFTLPTQIHSFAQPAGPCNRICWADANWNYNTYNDTPSLYCTNPAWYFAEYSSNAYCGDEAGNYISSYNAYGTQVPDNQTGDWQPNFQCADFVSRALTQDGLIPGLNNGGVYGRSPASPTVGDYDDYQAADDDIYRLWNVGVPGVPGLSDYLLDNHLATNIHTDVALARPGDVVFFIDQNGLYYHAMIITSLGNGYLVMDGHNAAQYHVVLKVTDFKLDIYHFNA